MAAGVTEVTVRNRYKELTSILSSEGLEEKEKELKSS
jgi:transcription initiation factor TFIIIB Brf1 subunit/transcription initiation factor TFIIB